MLIDELADVRTGDKGDDLIIAVLPRTTEGYEVLRENLTTDKVAKVYGLDESLVNRVLLPDINAMVFHLSGNLGGGVTGSSFLDGHGKTMGYLLLAQTIDTAVKPSVP